MKFSQIIGKHCYEVLHRLDKPREDCPHHCFLKTGTEGRSDLEEPWLGKIFDLITSPLRDSRGALKGCVIVLRDITERRRVEELFQEGERTADHHRFCARTGFLQRQNESARSRQ